MRRILNLQKLSPKPGGDPIALNSCTSCNAGSC